MGYKVKKKIFKLKFEDEEYEGCEVRVKSPNMGDFLDLSGLADIDIQDVNLADVAAVDRLFQLFAEAIIDWNLEDEDTGEPIPQTLAGLRSLDLDFVMLMVGAWMDAIKGVSPGLPQPSNDGQQSLEASIPMDDWSQSLQNLQEPAPS